MATDRDRAAKAPRGLWAAALGSALVAVLVPKCPLCVAAYLVLLGVSAGAASLAAPLLFPAAIALAALAFGAAVFRGRDRRRTRRSSPPTPACRCRCRACP